MNLHFRRNWTWLALGLALLVLTACGSGRAELPAAAGEHGIEIDHGTIMEDSAGVTVGFTKDGHAFRGDPEAPIVILEFSDYECPFCARFFQETMGSLENSRIESGDALLVFYDFPLTTIHPYAVASAHAARCAGAQGADKYWLMHDALFANQGQWSNNGYMTHFSNYAVSIGLDVAEFRGCMDSQSYLQALQEDVNYGRSRNVTGTPAFYINSQFLSGAQPINAFEQLITQILDGHEALLAQTNSGNSGASTAATPLPPPTPVAVGYEDGAGSMGDPDAAVTIVEYTDYGCPFCSRHSLQTMPTMVETMVDTGRVHYILKDLPLDSLHPEAREGAYAARCAGEQDAYWEMHDAIFAQQEVWTGQGDEYALTDLVRIAGEIGLDTDAMQSCLDSGRYEDAVQANVAEAESLGIGSTPYFLVNGYPVSGAQAIQVFELAVSAAEDGSLAQLYVQQQPSQQAQAQQAAPTPSGPVDVPLGDAPFIGDPDAPITIVEYSDFQCPFCGRHYAQTMPALIQQYIDTGQVRYVFKHFTPTLLNPSYHPQAVDAAMAAECARDQGAFWEMHDLLFTNQGQWGTDEAVTIFTGYAESLGLDAETFAACVNSDKHLETIQAILAEGQALGVRGTPAFFVNGNFVNGAQPFEVFDQILTQMLSDL
ncbi:MAG: DsbA family protein, partial [Anaerolineales bacterium]|nr:DsbA family protein [Anaerolineales bacterium]